MLDCPRQIINPEIERKAIQPSHSPFSLFKAGFKGDAVLRAGAGGGGVVSTVSDDQERKPGFPPFLSLCLCLCLSLPSRSNSLVAQSCLTLCDRLNSFTSKCVKWRLEEEIENVLTEVGGGD